MNCVSAPDGQKLLSPREYETLNLLCAGYSKKEITEKMGLKENSISTFISRARKKLRCTTTIQAAVKFKTCYQAQYARFSHKPSV